MHPMMKRSGYTIRQPLARSYTITNPHPQIAPATSPARSGALPLPASICPCDKVARLLADIGAPHAAAMHAKGEGNNGWTVDDLSMHMQEEETHLFPILLHIADTLTAHGDPEGAQIRHAVARLIADHGFIRRDYLDRGEIPSADKLKGHGMVEDILVTTWANEIRTLARRAA